MSVDSLDWKEISASEITQRVTSKVQPGSIVLFHNAAKHTPEALPGILEYLIGQGYSVIPISQLIVKGTCKQDYTIDHTGRQKAIAAPEKSSGNAAGSTAPSAAKSTAPSAAGSTTPSAAGSTAPSAAGSTAPSAAGSTAPSAVGNTALSTVEMD